MIIPSLTVFDIETTGLDWRRGDRIVEIAALRIDGGHIDEQHTFVSFVHPERSISLEAQRINKISDADVLNAPGIEEVLPQFLSFSEGSFLVAHNAQFDMGFLEHEKQFCWGFIDLPECLCTMRLSQQVFPDQFSHNLDALATRLKLSIPHKERHRALPDVLLTAYALMSMIHMVDTDSFDVIRSACSLRS